MDTALKGRDYLVGGGSGKYSIADIACWTFIDASMWCGVGALNNWPNVQAWWARIWARDAVESGVGIPYPAGNGNVIWPEKMKSDDKAIADEKPLKEALEKALK